MAPHPGDRPAAVAGVPAGGSDGPPGGRRPPDRGLARSGFVPGGARVSTRPEPSGGARAVALAGDLQGQHPHRTVTVAGQECAAARRGVTVGPGPSSRLRSARPSPPPAPVPAPGTDPVPEPEGTPTVLVQGRRHPRSDFDPGLAFAQLLPSPWSETNTVLCAGGWEGYTSPAVRRMLLDPSSPLVLAGNLGAMDEGGRGAAIELGDGGPSFVERVRQRVAPPVLEPGTKPVRTAAREPAAQRANRRLSAVCGAVLFFLVAARLSLMWQQSRARRAAFRRERRAGTAGGLL